jgi:hypothetical protein
MQLIVLGMHRSGTSMLTRLINLMGAYVGPERLMLRGARENPKGYWERSDVFPLNDAILRLRGCTTRIVAGWDFGHPPDLSQETEGAMRAIVSELDAFRPWVMKDPRLCLTLPCWIPILEAPIVVLVYRDPLEVISSLQQRGMRPEHSLSLWEHYVVGALNASRSLPRVFIHHDRLLTGPLDALIRLSSDLAANCVRGLNVPPDRQITDFVDQSLHRAKADALSGKFTLTSAQKALVVMLRGERPHQELLAVSAESLQTMSQIKE